MIFTALTAFVRSLFQLFSPTRQRTMVEQPAPRVAAHRIPDVLLIQILTYVHNSSVYTVCRQWNQHYTELSIISPTRFMECLRTIRLNSKERFPELPQEFTWDEKPGIRIKVEVDSDCEVGQCVATDYVDTFFLWKLIIINDDDERVAPVRDGWVNKRCTAVRDGWFWDLSDRQRPAVMRFCQTPESVTAELIYRIRFMRRYWSAA